MVWGHLWCFLAVKPLPSSSPQFPLFYRHRHRFRGPDQRRWALGLQQRTNVGVHSSTRSSGNGGTLRDIDVATQDVVISLQIGGQLVTTGVLKIPVGTPRVPCLPEGPGAHGPCACQKTAVLFLLSTGRTLWPKGHVRCCPDRSLPPEGPADVMSRDLPGHLSTLSTSIFL